jgi:DNA-binding beta-propeller fold protein YncE
VLVVSVSGENQAALIDPATYEVLARLPSGINPHDIAVSTDGSYAYIAVMGTPQEPGHSVTVLDLRQRVVKTTVELNPFNRCHDLRISRNGARLWATCAPSKAVIEIETRGAMSLTQRLWSLRINGAHAIWRRGGFSPPLSVIRAMGQGKPSPTMLGSFTGY